MHKVPVGSSISHAYEFLLQNLTAVIGTAWLPALLYGAGFFLFFQHMHDWMPAERQDLASVVLTASTVLGATAFTLIIRAVIGISLTQEALGVRKDFTLAHFVIGPRELRLFFAYVRFYLVVLLLYAAVVAVSVGAMYAAQHYGSTLAPTVRLGEFSLAVIAAALLTVILFIWFVLAMLRLFFLLAAVASAEHHARLSRAWTLTRRSELRIVAVYLGVFLPLVFASVVGLYFLIGPDQWAHVFVAMQTQKTGTPPALGPFYAEHAFIFAAVTGLWSLVGGALLAGASAHAYRAVTGHELPELEDDAALVAPLAEAETVVPTTVPVPAAEELPAPVHHDTNHGDHGLADVAPQHGGHDHHESHGNNGHSHNGQGHESHAADAHGGDVEDLSGDAVVADGHGSHTGDGHHHKHEDRAAA